MRSAIMKILEYCRIKTLPFWLLVCFAAPALCANDLPNGTIKTFYDNGKTVKEEKNYLNGQLNGPYRAYYENGQVQREATYKSGALTGPAKVYYKNGGLKTEINYVEGKRHGIKHEYTEEGRIILDQTYESDKLHGYSRLIDPKSESSENAGRVQGTVIRVIHPKHHPAPSPYRFLIKRALKPIHHAGETGRESFLANSSHETDEDFSSPPATNHHNAGMARTDSRGSPRECQSAPSYPAPNHQNAEVEGHTLFLLRKTNCGIDSSCCSSQNFPPPASAPESQNHNAGNSEKFVPPGMESRSPCASRSSKQSEVIGSGKSDSPFRSFLSYLWSKFFVSPFLTSGFNDPSMERVNGKWRRKA